MKEAKGYIEVMLMDFLKPRILSNSRSALKSSLKFCTMKETKKHFKIILMFFFFNIFWANVAFWAQELHFLILHKIKGQRGTPKSSQWFQNQLSSSSETNPSSRKWGNFSFAVENCFLLVSF